MSEHMKQQWLRFWNSWNRTPRPWRDGMTGDAEGLGQRARKWRGRRQGGEAVILVNWIEKPASVYEISHCVRFLTPDGRDHLLTASEALSLADSLKETLLRMAETSQDRVIGRVSEKKMRVQCLRVARAS